MRSNVRLFCLLLLSWILPACAAETSPAAIQGAAAESLETEDQRILYVLGHVLGQNIENAGLAEAEIASVLLGVSDSALGREPRIDLDQYGPQLEGFMRQRIETAAAAELAASTAFIDQQAAAAGARRTASGLVIQEITAGAGDPPAAGAVVTVHYHGTLRDGSVFDSSVERGEPATFALNQVIPCWTEGVQTIRVGGKSRLVCPPDLAYGLSSPPGIPANSALVFEVELLEIVEN